MRNWQHLAHKTHDENKQSKHTTQKPKQLASLTPPKLGVNPGAHEGQAVSVFLLYTCHVTHMVNSRWIPLYVREQILIMYIRRESSYKQLEAKIRRESSYKQLEVKTDRPSFSCGNRSGYYNRNAKHYIWRPKVNLKNFM